MHPMTLKRKALAISYAAAFAMVIANVATVASSAHALTHPTLAEATQTVAPDQMKQDHVQVAEKKKKKKKKKKKRRGSYSGS